MQEGQTIAGKYRLNRLLGEGGMASVWSATNVFTEREFAIKFMLPQVARTPEAARRFLLEAKVSARINHPNIIEIIDVGQAEDGSLFLVMELLNGQSLDVAVKTKEPPMLLREFVGVMRDVAEALAAAHRSGVIHRDLKPTNLLIHLDRDGRVVPKILDFGVSKILEDENNKNTSLTQVGTVLGSPLYMSPEQARGETDALDGRTDVFAFGSILFESLAGQRAFDAPNFNALIVAIATKDPKDIESVAPQLPGALKALVRECMAPDRDERIASFDLVVDRMRAMASEIEASPLRVTMLGAMAPRDADATDVLPAVREEAPPAAENHASLPPPPAPVATPASALEQASPPAMHVSYPPPSGNGPPPVFSVPPPGAITANQSPAIPLALGAGGAVVLLGIVLAIAAAFGHSRPAGHGASASAAAVTVSGAVAAPKIAPPVEEPSASSEVPVVSVDSLPVAGHRGGSKSTGRLSVTAGPGWCKVSIDGTVRGVTPIVDAEVAAGVHRVDCAPPHGKTKSTTVSVADGTATQFGFALDE